jgi:hypothetical protein
MTGSEQRVASAVPEPAAPPPRPYSEGLFREGLGPAVEALLGAIPQERRAWWDRVVMSDTTPEGEYLRDGVVGVVFQRGRRYVLVPVSIALVADTAGHPNIAPYLEERARRYYDELAWKD